MDGNSPWRRAFIILIMDSHDLKCWERGYLVLLGRSTQSLDESWAVNK